MKYVEHTYTSQPSAVKAMDSILLQWERDRLENHAHVGHIDLLKYGQNDYRVCVTEFDQPMDGVM